MLAQVIKIFVDYISAYFLSGGVSQDFVEKMTGVLKRSLKQFVLLIILLICFFNSMILLIAEVLLQKYTSNQLVFSPLIAIGGAVMMTCLAVFGFTLKFKIDPKEKTKSSENLNAKSLANLMESCSVLILQYAEERKEKMKLKT